MGIDSIESRYMSSYVLFIFRASLGLLIFFLHGLPAMENYKTLVSTFPDPWGVGSAASLAFALFVRLGCSLALVLGLFTRIAAFLSCFLMAITFFVVKSNVPLLQREVDLVYLVCFILIFSMGPGKYSLDSIWSRGL